MREYIVEQMKQGKSLEEIHMEVEQMFNEEYNKREEEIKQKLAQIEAAFDRAAQAMADYLTLMTGQPADVEAVKQAMTFAEVKCFHAPMKATKAKKDAAAAPKEPVVEVIKAKTNDEEADRALMQFLMDMGLIKLVD